MNKIRIIDLLNKIANGEEMPKYIQYYNMLKDKTDIMMVCKENIFYKLDQLEIQLNSRVEILEEEKKIPEKLETYKDKNNTIFLDDLCYKYMPIHKDSLSFNEQVIVDKLNEVLDYLKSKGE